MRAVIAAVGAFMLTAQAPAAENWPDSVDEYVKQVRATLQTTDMDGYLAAVKDPQGALLLDVREEDEFKAGHVPGTVHIPRGFLEFRIWKQLGYPTDVDTGRKIYVQCRTGGRATLAARQLKDIGFTNVVAVVMELREWEDKGHPLVK
jgi:rhodanese-related sulfurtransferase